MLQKIILLSLLILFTSFGFAQSERINIKTDQLRETNYLKANDFYLTHYLYIDLFLRENLFPEATSNEVSSILDAIKTFVSPEQSLRIEIEKPGKRNYKINIAILKKEGKELFIAFTNWNLKKRIFEKRIEIENDSYARWYFLNGNKMTYRKDMSEEKDYNNISKTDLIDAYLFDELAENDTLVKSAIKEVLNEKSLSVEDEIMANLLLLKYHILHRDDDNIKKQTAYITFLFKKHSSENNLKGLEMAFNATQFQIELTN